MKIRRFEDLKMKYNSSFSAYALIVFWVISILVPMRLSADSDKLSLASRKRFYIRRMLADSSTLPLAKDIYHHKPWKLSNENGKLLLSLLDSFPKMDSSIKGFYFIVIAKSYDKSDGFYSEGLGALGKDYIDTHLLEFLSYFIGPGRLSYAYLDKYAGIYWLEQAIVCDADSKAIQDSIYNTYKEKKKLCHTKKQQDVLTEFWMDLSTDALVADIRKHPLVPIIYKPPKAVPR